MSPEEAQTFASIASVISGGGLAMFSAMVYVELRRISTSISKMVPKFARVEQRLGIQADLEA